MCLARAVSVLLFVFAFSLVSGQDSRLISWTSPRQLNREYFRMEVPQPEARSVRKGRFVISTEGFIYCGISFSFSQTGSRLEYVVNAVMDPLRSWLADPEDAGTLAHEQAHFNITEIYARRLRKELRSTKSIDKARRLYYSHLQALERRQKEFDGAHKGESGVEEKWDNWIKGELAQLTAFSDSLILTGP